MKHPAKTLLWLTLATALLLTGCGATKAPPARPIQIAIIEDVTSLDPADSKDFISESVARCLFSTLYTFDEEMNLVPCLAQSAQQVSDTQWEFQIKPNALFHDGSKLTAADVKFSIQRAQRAPRSDTALAVITQLDVVDDTTIRMTTQSPMPTLPSLLVRTSTSIMSEQAMAQADYDITKPIGSGPFMLLEHVAEEGIYLSAFADYFAGAPKTQLLHFIIEPSEQNSTAAILNETVDVLFRVSASDGDYLDLNEDITLYQADSTKMELLFLNAKAAPTETLLVRQAIAHAIDKENLIRNVLDGYGRPLSSMIPAPLLGFRAFEDYSYDPDKARALLEQAGYPEGLKLTLLTFDIQRKKLMEYLKLDMARVGIELDYEFLELADYLALVEQRAFTGSIMSWASNPDPDSTFAQLYSSTSRPTLNQTDFFHPRVEELLLLGRSQQDPAQRQAIYEEINQLVAQSYQIIPLYQPAVLVAASKDIQGIRINAQGLFGYENLSWQMPQP